MRIRRVQLVWLAGLTVLVVVVVVAVSVLDGFGNARDASTTTSTAGGSQATNASSGQANVGRLTPQQLAVVPDCGMDPIFTALPMALTDFRAFRPLGFLAPPIHILGAKHSNFSINLPGETKSGLAVHFPGDAVVTNITSLVTNNAPTGYQLTFFACKAVKSYLYHLGSVPQQLSDAMKSSEAKCQVFDFGPSQPAQTKCSLDTAIPVKAGQLAGASDSFAGVDWGAVDYRSAPLAFANLKRYDGDYPYYRSPLDYLPTSLRAQLATKTGAYDGSTQRTATPVGGSLLQDIVGTAQGNWFIGNQSFMTTSDFSPFMALAHDYVDPTQPVFSMGISVPGVKLGLYGFKPQPTGLVNRDFGDLKPDGQTYCYDNFLSGTTIGRLPLGQINGVLIITMPTPITLKIERQDGNCATPAHAFSTTAITFER